jgi:chromosome segregation ATPase
MVIRKEELKKWEDELRSKKQELDSELAKLEKEEIVIGFRLDILNRAQRKLTEDITKGYEDKLAQVSEKKTKIRNQISDLAVLINYIEAETHVF